MKAKKGMCLVILILLSLSAYAAINTITQFSSTLLDFTTYQDSTNITIEGDALVLNASFKITGMLGDWVIVYFYNGTSPVDADYVNDDKWLISDISSGLYLVNPQDGSIYDSYAGFNMYDAEWISDSKWFYVDYNNNKVVLFNASSDSEISNYGGLTNPEAAQYINDTKWLIADTGNNKVSLVDDGLRIRNYSNALNQPSDVYYINDEEWLIVSKDGLAGKIVHAN